LCALDPRGPTSADWRRVGILAVIASAGLFFFTIDPALSSCSFAGGLGLPAHLLLPCLRCRDYRLLSCLDLLSCESGFGPARKRAASFRLLAGPRLPDCASWDSCCSACSLYTMASVIRSAALLGCPGSVGIFFPDVEFLREPRSWLHPKGRDPDVVEALLK
jgi:hypothetical protein